MIKGHLTLDHVLDAALPALQLSVRCAPKQKAFAIKCMGDLSGLMLVVHKNAARKRSSAATLTLQHALNLLDALPTGESTPNDGYAVTVVGVMKEHAGVLEMHLSGMWFLKECISTAGMDAAITESDRIVPTSNTYTGDVSWIVNTGGASVIPNLVGEEQLLIGSPVVKAVQDIQLCQNLGSQCQEFFSAGNMQRAELTFAAEHTTRLKTNEMCKNQDCEDFAADMHNYMRACTHAFVMTVVTEHIRRCCVVTHD